MYYRLCWIQNSISGKDIAVKSRLINCQMLEPGEEVKADWGFTIEDCLSTLGVKLVISSFLNGREQFCRRTVIKYERMTQRLKCFHIFDRLIPLQMIGLLNQIITAWTLLSNFQEPIIKGA